jgi:hypothetical protein
VTPVLACPWCGSVHEALAPNQSGLGQPQGGDIALCIVCGRFAIFQGEIGELSLRKPNSVEGLRLSTDPYSQAMSAAWRQMQDSKGMKRGKPS